MNEEKTLRPGQLLRFNDKLMDTAPKDYKPHYFPVQKNGKDPDSKGSWKTKYAKLTVSEARERMKQGIGNVGIAGRPNDALLLLDVDDPSVVPEVKETLTVRSRSRGTKDKPALHAIYWADPEDEKLPCNIATDKKGELRSEWQYVVAPGSYVPCTKEELENKVEQGKLTKTEKQEILQDPFRGYYTIEDDREIATLSFEELPEAFKEEHTNQRNRNTQDIDYDVEKDDIPDNASELFYLDITDVTEDTSGREPHPLHDSETGANWCVEKSEDDEGNTRLLGHCWRHTVSHNAITFLCVESGFMSCNEAGIGHNPLDKKQNPNPSKVKGNDEAVWKAWKYAKQEGYIPDDDPIPGRAMNHIARKHNLYNPDKGEMLPPQIYRETLRILEEEY